MELYTLSAASMLAACCNRIFTISVCPLLAARTSGVPPISNVFQNTQCIDSRKICLCWNRHIELWKVPKINRIFGNMTLSHRDLCAFLLLMIIRVFGDSTIPQVLMSLKSHHSPCLYCRDECYTIPHSQVHKYPSHKCVSLFLITCDTCVHFKIMAANKDRYLVSRINVRSML